MDLVEVNEAGNEEGGPFEGTAMTYYGRWTYKYEKASELFERLAASASSLASAMTNLSSDDCCDANLLTTIKGNVYSPHPNNNNNTGSMTGRLTILLANCCFLLGFLKMLHLSDFLANSTHPLLRAW